MNNHKTLTNAEIASFCKQTAMIIKAGITPAEGMEILVHDTISEDGKALLKEISVSCQKGNFFHQAISSTGVFPEYVSRLIALGEESGNLDSVLISLSDYYDREDDIADNIKSAVSYPLIMIAMMFLIIIVLIMKVLPIFKQVFTQLGAEMSPLAQKLMNIGTSLSQDAIVITSVLAVIVLTIIVLYRVPSLKKKMRLWFAKFPLTKGFYSSIAAGRFASGMYLAFSSGMDMFHALDMVSELVENNALLKKIDIVREEIKNNSTFAEAVMKAEIFNNLYSRMIAVGFKSGSVDTVMLQISDYYEQSTEKQLRRVVSIIEPTLVIILSLIVGIILLSVLLPLMGIMSSIG